MGEMTDLCLSLVSPSSVVVKLLLVVVVVVVVAISRVGISVVSVSTQNTRFSVPGLCAVSRHDNDDCSRGLSAGCWSFLLLAWHHRAWGCRDTLTSVLAASTDNADDV